MEKDYQQIINKMGRATTGTFQSTPRGIVLAESKLAPAGPLLDYRQASFTKRLMARPKGHHGPEEILERRGTDLTERLRQNSFVENGEQPEEMGWPKHRRFQGRIEVEQKGEALRKAKTGGTPETPYGRMDHAWKGGRWGRRRCGGRLKESSRPR